LVSVATSVNEVSVASAATSVTEATALKIFFINLLVAVLIYSFRKFPCLGSRHNLLEVVDVEVLLEVEVRELDVIREVEELEERRIRLDVVLVLEVLLLDVRRDELRDVGAALLGAGRAAHERAEGRRDVRGDLEDGDTRRLALLALNRRLAAAALVGELLDLRGLLL